MNLYFIIALVIIYLVPYICFTAKIMNLERKIEDLELCRDQARTDIFEIWKAVGDVLVRLRRLERQSL